MSESRSSRAERREERVRAEREASESVGFNRMPCARIVPYLGFHDESTARAAAACLIQRGPDSVPALIEGMANADGRVRAACALLLDHFADDRCIAPLLHAIRNDPLEAVRRCALHALVCDGCKTCPLSVDAVAVLIDTAKTDRSLAVRRRAVFYLSMQRADLRIAPFLKNLLANPLDDVTVRRAARALRMHGEEAGATSVSDAGRTVAVAT